jgi:hypothetical protein
MLIRFWDISWDTDGEDADLPTDVTLEVENDLDIANDGADVLSDKFGFLVEGFYFDRV